MASLEHRIPIRRVTDEMKLTIRVTGVTAWRIRAIIGAAIMRLGARIAGFRKVELEIS